jgi:hypothetical protein
MLETKEKFPLSFPHLQNPHSFSKAILHSPYRQNFPTFLKKLGVLLTKFGQGTCE